MQCSQGLHRSHLPLLAHKISGTNGELTLFSSAGIVRRKVRLFFFFAPLPLRFQAKYVVSIYTHGQQAGLIVGHSDMDLPEVSEDAATEACIHHVLFQARSEYNGCIFIGPSLIGTSEHLK